MIHPKKFSHNIIGFVPVKNIIVYKLFLDIHVVRFQDYTSERKLEVCEAVGLGCFTLVEYNDLIGQGAHQTSSGAIN